MKKTVIKGIAFVVIFVISLVVISMVANQGNGDMTAPMSAASQSQLEAALALLRSDAQEGAGGDRKAGARRVRKAPTGPASGAS